MYLNFYSGHYYCLVQCYWRYNYDDSRSERNRLNTLFNLGAEPKTIKAIFFLQGTLMTILSGVAGLVTMGLIIIFLSVASFEWIMLASRFSLSSKS